VNINKHFFTWRVQAIYWGAAILLVLTAFPLFWMTSTAFKPLDEIFVHPPSLLPKHFTLANLARLFEQTRFLTYFKNSLLVSTTTVVLTMIVATTGAYGLTRFRFYGREKIASLILFIYMFAPIMIAIPFYVLIRKLGIANTHLALILAYTTFCLPFSLWLLRAFFQSIPLELEKAPSPMVPIERGRCCMSYYLSPCPASLPRAFLPSSWPGMIIFLYAF
jgi:multiple sugar transport system permease protein